LKILKFWENFELLKQFIFFNSRILKIGKPRPERVLKKISKKFQNVHKISKNVKMITFSKIDQKN
jgi:hypothetical protein